MRIKTLELLEHHPEHYINVKLFGEKYKLCSRCTGQYLAGIPAMLLAIYAFYFTDISFDFTTVFTLTWVLAGLTILDWSSVELLHIRKGNNTTRLITGATLGTSIAIYIWILPASWSFKAISLVTYYIIFTAIALSVNAKKHDINLLEEIKKGYDNIIDMLFHPKKLWLACNCCPCCSTGCCCGTTSCCPMMLCLLSCCLPCLCCPMLSGKGFGCGSCNSCGSNGLSLCGNKKKTK